MRLRALRRRCRPLMPGARSWPDAETSDMTWLLEPPGHEGAEDAHTPEPQHRLVDMDAELLEGRVEATEVDTLCVPAKREKRCRRWVRWRSPGTDEPAVCEFCFGPGRFLFTICKGCGASPSMHHGRCFRSRCENYGYWARVPYHACWYCGAQHSWHHGRCCH